MSLPGGRYSVIYSGAFLSKEGVAWRVDISRRGSAPAEVGELIFPADEPLLIEWAETAKEDVICGSAATLKIESPGDRTYIGLYSIAPFEVRLDVYRKVAGEWQHYWRGCLDPELYEEPYERANGYDVTLVFSDFGGFSRLKYLGGKPVTTNVQALLNVAFLRAGLIDTMPLGNEDTDSIFNVSQITTKVNDESTRLSLGRLLVQGANFYDEDEEPQTYEEVITGILQPFGLKLIQRNGEYIIFDLQGLSETSHTDGVVYWTGDSQTLGVDKVASEVKVTLSTYTADGKIIEDKVEWLGDTDLEKHIGEGDFGEPIASADPGRSDYVETIYGSMDEDAEESFNLYAGLSGSGVQTFQYGAYFHIEPIFGGSETNGILGGTAISRPGREMALSMAGLPAGSSLPMLGINSPGEKVFTTGRFYCPPKQGKCWLNLQLPALLSAKNNPFGSTDNNNSETDDKIKEDIAWIFLPVGVNIYRSQDAAAPYAHWDNSGVAYRYLDTIAAKEHNDPTTQGKWVEGAASLGDCWLAYYDGEDLKKKSPWGDWMTNRHNRGCNDVETVNATYFIDNGYGITAPVPTLAFEYAKEYARDPQMNEGKYDVRTNKQSDGEVIAYPEEGGWIEVVVYRGMVVHDYGKVRSTVAKYAEDDGGNDIVVWYLPDVVREAPADKRVAAFFYIGAQRAEDVRRAVRWYMFQHPKITITTDWRVVREPSSDDIEHKGEINANAKEPLEINTICGTMNPPVAGSRATMLYMMDGNGVAVVSKATRAGHIGMLEDLLIGTYASQYAGRHVKLTGEARIFPYWAALREPNQPADKSFIITAETQNLIEDTTEMTIVELSPDDYSYNMD